MSKYVIPCRVAMELGTLFSQEGRPRTKSQPSQSQPQPQPGKAQCQTPGIPGATGPPGLPSALVACLTGSGWPHACCTHHMALAPPKAWRFLMQPGCCPLMVTSLNFWHDTFLEGGWLQWLL